MTFPTSIRHTVRLKGFDESFKMLTRGEDYSNILNIGSYRVVVELNLSATADKNEFIDFFYHQIAEVGKFSMNIPIERDIQIALEVTIANVEDIKLQLQDGETIIMASLVTKEAIQITPTAPPLQGTVSSPDAVADNRFGVDIAVSGNGLVVAITAYTPNGNGKVYLFDRVSGTLVYRSSFVSPDQTSASEFAKVSLNFDGSIIVVGQPVVNKVHIFKDGVLKQTITGANEFGYDVSLSANGLYLVVSAVHYDSNKGRCLAYSLSADCLTSTLLFTIQNPTSGSSRFGYSVSLSEALTDGTYVLALGYVGSGYAAVVIYSISSDFNSATLLQNMRVDNVQNIPVVSVKKDASLFLVGKPYEDKIYVYDHTYALTHTLTSTLGTGILYGFGVAFDPLSDKILVGAIEFDTANTNEGIVQIRSIG